MAEAQEVRAPNGIYCRSVERNKHMSELIIEVGKHYQTRDGRKARIYALDGCAPHVVHGAILDEEGWESYSGWMTSGKYFGEDDSSPRDLIAPWIDKPSFDRSLLPAWANKAMAMDAGNCWYCFSEVPIPQSDSQGNWDGGGWQDTIPREFAPKWSGNWKDSLLTFED